MVPDRSARPRDRPATDRGPTDDAEEATPHAEDATYDLVYRATRDALWDVLGTATLIVFYIVLAAIALSIAVGGLGRILGGSASYTTLGVGALALVVGAVAAVRVYQLVTE